MSKFFTAFFFALILSTAGFSQQFIIDSLKRELSQHPTPDTNRVNLLNEISYHNIGINYYFARDYALQALQLSEHLMFKKGIAVSKTRLALSHWVLGDGELAVENGLAAASIAEQEHLLSILAESYRILSVTYTDQRDLEKAEAYARRAEKLCLLTENWGVLSRVYVASGVIQASRKNYDSALSLYRKSLLIAEERNNNYYLPIVYTHIGRTYGLENPHDPKELDYYFKALALSIETENKYARASVLSKLGCSLFERKNYVEAENYLLQSQEISHALGLKTVLRDNLLQLMNLKLQQNKLSEAFTYMKEYYELKDSLLNEKRTRQIVELETQHEIEKREQAILFLEQEKRLQTLWQNALLLGFLVITTASIIIYRLMKSRAKKANELLLIQKELNHKLREADALKSKFIANISHEFRTPLSLIAAPIEEKLSSNSLSSSDKKTFQLVKRNTHRLLTLVTQLLDLSKLEVGKMKLELRQGDLTGFLKILAASFESLAEVKKIHFSKNIHITTTDTWFDADKLEKIMNNLMFNAFKFTPMGGAVTLTIFSDRACEEMQIKISDTGAGIPKEDLEHVFTPYYQAKNVADEGQAGTGLGLSLVKELVTLYGGVINLSSVENKGTVVTLTLPIKRNRFSDDLLNPGELGTGKNPEPYFETNENYTFEHNFDTGGVQTESILIVEDNVDLRNFIASSLHHQFAITTASDGEEGFNLATERIPSLIISDLMMPHVDGVALTKKIKNDERTSHIPVVLLTAKADQESRLEGFTAGADDYLAKPFSTHELRVRINNLIDQRKKLAAKFRNQLADQSKSFLPASLDEKFLQKAKTIVETHISDSGFGVEQMAEEMCLSRTQLFRKIKGVAGLSPNEFINNIRLQKAATLIQAKADSLSQISYAVGFSDQSYFAKRFRKKFGTSPTEYSHKFETGSNKSSVSDVKSSD